jgi:hypothetical protein
MIDEEFDLSFDEFEPFENFEEPEEPETDEPGEPREDKIFNNRYNTGEGLDESEEYQFSKNISVSEDYSDAYLKDLYDYENELDLKVVLDFIFKEFSEDPEINKIFEISKEGFNQKKIKISKNQLNFVFTKLHEKISKNNSGYIFYSPIYILEVISSVASLEYKKLFDMLNTDNQEILLIELNEKYLFLEGKMNKKRIH